MEESPIKRFFRVFLVILYCASFLFSVLIGFSLQSFWFFLIFFLISWLVIDIVNISTKYITSGKTSTTKSWIYRGFLILFNYDSFLALIKNELDEVMADFYSDFVDKKLSELMKIIPKNKIVNVLKMDKAASEQEEQALSKLAEIYKRTGKDENFFGTKESWELDLDTLKSQNEYARLSKQARGFLNLTSPLMGDFVLLNHKLDKGKISLEKVYSKLHKESKKRYDQFCKDSVNFSVWVSLSNALIKAKESGVAFDKAKIKNEDIKEEIQSYLADQISTAESLVI